VRIRQGRKSDVRFITNSWLKSYREAHTVKGCPNQLYFSYQHKIIEALLPASGVLVLCDTKDDDHILGWLVYQRAQDMVLIHYAYVKHPFRRKGLATNMIRALLEVEPAQDGGPPTVLYTHKTKALNEINHNYRIRERKEDVPNPLESWVFDPYKLWLQLPVGWWH